MTETPPTVPKAKTHYEIQMKHLRDAAGLIQTIDIPAMIVEAMHVGSPKDMLVLMALNNIRPLLPSELHDGRKPRRHGAAEDGKDPKGTEETPHNPDRMDKRG